MAPVGSMSISTVRDVTLVEGGCPSISPPLIRKSDRKAPHVG